MSNLCLWVALYFSALNLLCFALFGLDKHRALDGAWRVPEKSLLLIAAAGGIVGAICGQQYFRHKTRKQPFRSILLIIAFVQTFLIFLLGSSAIFDLQLVPSYFN